MVINVGDGEIILEGGDDQDEGRKKYHRKGGDPGAPRGLAQPFRSRARTSQGQRSRQERIGAERQGEQKRETADLRHGEARTVSFQKQRFEATREWRKTDPVGQTNHVGTAALGCPVEQRSTALCWQLDSELRSLDSRGRLSPHVVLDGLSALLLVVTRQHFLLGDQPILIFVAWRVSPLAHTVHTRDGGFPLPGR